MLQAVQYVKEIERITRSNWHPPRSNDSSPRIRAMHVEHYAKHKNKSTAILSVIHPSESAGGRRGVPNGSTKGFPLRNPGCSILQAGINFFHASIAGYCLSEYQPEVVLTQHNKWI